jgi:polyisoprenyl-phosphate glycosyltransferase
MAEVSRVAAIVPAYNEEKTIGQVVAALQKVKKIEKILVVDDGSEDRTALEAKKAGAEVVSLKTNQGKGEAMEIGVKKANPEIIVFADGDLLNLQASHLEKLLQPVIENRVWMTTGTLERGEYINRLNQHLEAPFSGLRVVRRELWEKVPFHLKKGYLIESGLHWTAKKEEKEPLNFILPGLGHLTKIEKQGRAKGVFNYLRMWLGIFFGFPYRLLVKVKKRRVIRKRA